MSWQLPSSEGYITSTDWNRPREHGCRECAEFLRTTAGGVRGACSLTRCRIGLLGALICRLGVLICRLRVLIRGLRRGLRSLVDLIDAPLVLTRTLLRLLERAPSECTLSFTSPTLVRTNFFDAQAVEPPIASTATGTATNNFWNMFDPPRTNSGDCPAM